MMLSSVDSLQVDTGLDADLKSGLSDYETADGGVLGPPAVRVRQLENCKLQNLQCQKTDKSCLLLYFERLRVSLSQSESKEGAPKSNSTVRNLDGTTEPSKLVKTYHRLFVASVKRQFHWFSILFKKIDAWIDQIISFRLIWQKSLDQVSTLCPPPRPSTPARRSSPSEGTSSFSWKQLLQWTWCRFPFLICCCFQRCRYNYFSCYSFQGGVGKVLTDSNFLVYLHSSDTRARQFSDRFPVPCQISDKTHRQRLERKPQKNNLLFKAKRHFEIWALPCHMSSSKRSC